MKQILMAEPNISEGRNLDLVQQIVAAVRAVPGVTVADYSSDAAHNRSVISFVGEPNAVLAGAKALALKTYELTDMAHLSFWQTHTGGRPLATCLCKDRA